MICLSGYSLSLSPCLTRGGRLLPTAQLAAERRLQRRARLHLRRHDEHELQPECVLVTRPSSEEKRPRAAAASAAAAAAAAATAS